MARWKIILISVAAVIMVLIVALYAYLSLYDFNKFKPMIAKAVKDAIGRELKIAGDIEFELGIRPTLVVEDVSLQNAAWSATPDLALIKRMEVQIALLPIVTGKFDFAHLVLVEPIVIVEFNSAGTSNFSFETSGEAPDDSEIPPPPLIFSDILIENGLFNYKDARSGFSFSVRIDHLQGEIPGFDEPIELDFKGAFDDKPLTLEGSLGPIWAWVEPGYSLPANLTATAGGATATIRGELRDPINFKGLAFDISAKGSSVAEITGLAGIADVPELGAFKLTAGVNDSAGSLAVEKLDIQIGKQELVAISLTGEINNVINLQGINLNFSAQGQDSANLTQLGLPALPERGAFQVAAQISDPEAKVFSASDLRVVLGENEVNGQIDLNLAEKIPFLSARLTSQKFRYGQLNLDLKMNNPVEKPAIEKIDLKVGNPDLAKITLHGKVDDLMELQGVDIKFQASGKDLANLEKFTGQPFPVRGAFSAAGKVLIPVHKNLKIPDLKVKVGKNNITGSLNLDLRGEKPQLETKLSLAKLDLPSVLLLEPANEGWAKGLGLMSPVNLTVKLAGFAQELILEKIDLQAGNSKAAELSLTGSVANLLDQRGIDLKFFLKGNDVNKLKDITGQPYFFAPVPGEGAYTLSGHISNPAAEVYKIKDFKYEMSGTVLAGDLDFNLAGQVPVYEVKLSAPKFNMKPFPIPEEAAYAKLNKIDDLGPLKIHSKVVIEADRLAMPHLVMQAGSEKLASVEVNGSIKNLTKQTGIDLNFIIRGNEFTNLKKVTDAPLPLKGAYALSGRLTDPAKEKYSISKINFKLGKNNINGSLDLNLSGKTPGLATNLTAPNFTLQPVTLPALETLSRIEDLGPLKLVLKLVGAGEKYTLDNLDFKLGREDLVEVVLKGTIKDLSAVQGMKLDFSARGSDISNFEKLGGPEIKYTGAFNVSGQFVDPAPQVYRLPSLNATVGDNNQTGWLELDLSAKRPSLKGELSSDKLDLRPLLAKEKKEIGKVKPQPAKSEPPGEKKTKGDIQSPYTADQHKRNAAKVFPAETLPLEGLQAMDIDLKIRNKQVLLPAWALDDIILDILLKSGNLEVKPFKFSIGGGKADVQFALHSQEKPAALAANLNVNQLEIGPMLDKLGYPRNVEGNLDADFNLNSAGNSVAALMAGLNGNTRIAMGNGKAASRYLELLEKYLGSDILRMINPFQEKREFTPVNCFVNTIEINDGLADIKIFLDTDRTSIIGAGKINLETEALNLGIKPTPKKGAMPASISFSFRELSQPFKLGGTLAEPSLAIDAGRTAFIIGKMAGALALGPIGIAAFFADVSIGKQDPCAIAMGDAEIKGKSAGTKKAEDSSKETAAEEDQKEEKKPGRFYRRLLRGNE
ncbi:MAG: AsmA family protein [bacterium]|nr:AsmA family protein [bacterium]